jgi:hypothetical protein
MIEKTQKQILFEEAAKKGIMDSQIQQIPDILRSIVGVSDINKQQYGMPLAPIYTAKSGEHIDISRLSNFFSGLLRDTKVSSVSLESIENDLLLFNLEIWTRMQLLKNKAQDISKKAKVERYRASFGATWIFTETFSKTDLIDMQSTNSWLDTSEGIAYIPNLGDEKSIPMSTISLMEYSIPETSSFLGSNPKFAFDGLDSTNWRCLFVTDEFTAATFSLASATSITSISIDPIGFGIDVIIETEINGKFEQAIRSIVYSKRTFSLLKSNVSKVRVKFKAATSVLPKVVGIKEIILFQSGSLKTSEVYSKKLKPNEPFTEIKVATKGQVPQGTSIKTYFRSTSGGAWQPIYSEDWQPVYPTDTASIFVNYTEASSKSSTVNFSGLYGKQLQLSAIPVTTVEGVLGLGSNMVEVSAFKKDWLEIGDVPKLLTLEDFDAYPTKRTWSTVPLKSFTASGSGTCLQLYGETTIKNDTSISRGGPFMAFQRRLAESTYNQFCIVPLTGANASGMMQYGHNYRIAFMAYCPKAVTFQDAKYWFYQGYRQANRRFFKDIGKSFGTFAFYLNGNLIASEKIGKTISTDNKIEGKNLTDVDLGTSFTMNLIEGWNKIEILMNVIDPNQYGADIFDAQNQPYLQLSLYPSLFDTSLSYGTSKVVTDIIASGEHKPVNEFDLLWNLPSDPSFWAWSSDRQYLLFNTNQLNSIDGYFTGSAPLSVLKYKSIQSNSIDDLYIKVVLEREDNTQISPIIDEYSVMVR